MQKKENNKEQKAAIYKAEKQEKINMSKVGPQKTLIKLIHCFKKRQVTDWKKYSLYISDKGL